MAIIEKILINTSEKINKNKYIKAMREAFSVVFPITLVSSILIMVSKTKFLQKFFDKTTILASFMDALTLFSFGIISVFVAGGVGYSLAKHYKINALNVAILSVITLILQVDDLKKFEILGFKSIFASIFLAIAITEIYIKVSFDTKNPIINSITTFLPAFFVIIFALFIKICFSFTGYNTVLDAVYILVQSNITKIFSLFFPTLVIGVLCNLFWYYGLHGQAMIYGIMMPIWASLNTENIIAFQASETVPNLISSSFIGANVTLGGWISIPFIIALFICKKDKNIKKIEKSDVILGIFNIYEPIMFGYPLVMNKKMLIPLLLTPIITTTVMYNAMFYGFVPYATGVQLPLTTPIGLVGVLTTNSLTCGLIQLAIIPFLTLMWVFFLKIGYKKDKN